MKLLIIALLTLGSSIGFAYSDEAVTAAQDLYNETMDSESKGKVQNYDTLIAKKNLLDMQELKTSDKKTYCQDVLPLQQKISDDTHAKYKMKWLKIKDLTQAQAELYRLKEYCK